MKNSIFTLLDKIPKVLRLPLVSRSPYFLFVILAVAARGGGEAEGDIYGGEDGLPGKGESMTCWNITNISSVLKGYREKKNKETWSKHAIFIPFFV